MAGIFAFSETQVGEKDEGRGCKREIGHAGKRCHAALCISGEGYLTAKLAYSIIGLLLKYFWLYHREKGYELTVICFSIFLSPHFHLVLHLSSMISIVCFLLGFCCLMP